VATDVYIHPIKTCARVQPVPDIIPQSVAENPENDHSM